MHLKKVHRFSGENATCFFRVHLSDSPHESKSRGALGFDAMRVVGQVHPKERIVFRRKHVMVFSRCTYPIALIASNDAPQDFDLKSKSCGVSDFDAMRAIAG